MKLCIAIDENLFVTDFISDTDAISREVSAWLATLPSPVDSAVAFGLGWGAWLNGFADSDNPLSISANWNGVRVKISISDPILEAAYGVSRQ